MRHKFGYKKLNRTSEHRKALLKLKYKVEISKNKTNQLYKHSIVYIGMVNDPPIYFPHK